MRKVLRCIASCAMAKIAKPERAGRWATFCSKATQKAHQLKLIVTGGSLMTGAAKRNLTQALLGGEALQSFNNEAMELSNKASARRELSTHKPPLSKFSPRALCKLKGTTCVTRTLLNR